MGIDKYLGLITSQHRAKPKFTSWLTSPLLKIQDAKSLLLELISAFDIDNAAGVQLDKIGEVIGLKRDVWIINDDFYRAALKCQALINLWDGSKEGIETMWEVVFPFYGLSIQDVYFDNTMNINYKIFGSLDENFEFIFKYIFPKISGVKATYSNTHMGNGVHDISLNPFDYESFGFTAILSSGLAWVNGKKAKFKNQTIVDLPMQSTHSTRDFLITIAFNGTSMYIKSVYSDSGEPEVPSDETPLWRMKREVMPDGNLIETRTDLRIQSERTTV